MDAYRTSDNIPLACYVTDVVGAALTGLADLYVRVRRHSDGYFLDWNDYIFKSGSWTTINKLLVEANATYASGIYSVSLPSSQLVNAAADDEYQAIWVQTPGTTAVLPAPAPFQIGWWAQQVALAHKILRNKMQMVPGLAGNMVIYDDDGVTPLLSFDVADLNGATIELADGAPARRSRGA
jgi:hypothetical protein